jgi:phage-related protein
MTRAPRVAGEKPLFWIGSARHDLLEFPEAVKNEIGTALSVAQFGGKPPALSHGRERGQEFSRWLKSTAATPTRAVYTVRFAGVVYVLHAFQKKSPTGIKTAQPDVALIADRLRAAREDYATRYGKGKQ